MGAGGSRRSPTPDRRRARADTPVAAVRIGHPAEQRTVAGTLGTIAADVAAAGTVAAVTVVGDGRRPARASRGSRRGRCSGARSSSPAPRAGERARRARLRELGAEVDRVPVDPIEPLDGALPDRRAPRTTARLRHVAQRRRRLLSTRCGGDARALAGVEVAAIGPGTAAALREAGSSPTSCPSASSPRRCSRRSRPTCAGTRVLLARAEPARDVLPDGLAGRGTASTSRRSTAPSPRPARGAPSACRRPTRSRSRRRRR